MSSLWLQLGIRASLVDAWDKKIRKSTLNGTDFSLRESNLQ